LDKRLIFLDRDGTLIHEKVYLKDPRKVRLLAGTVSGLKALKRAGWAPVLLTNQSGVGRGLLTRQDVDRVHRRLQQLLGARGVRLAGVYWCPHHPDAGCACRKPKLKLVRKASRDLGIPWRGSFSVGDKWSDVAIGRRTGGKGVLVLTGYGRRMLAKNPGHRPADFVTRDFRSAVRWIIQQEGRESRLWKRKKTKP
jgi:D-glycero-D-manno-heptose 1,7-bisphosphate phosphatase